MSDTKYEPVTHDQRAFLKRALKRQGFREAYTALEDEYQLARELLLARTRAGLTQEEVAASMGTTKSSISRLEASGRHSPSVNTLRRYARAVGCDVEIRLIPSSYQRGASRKGTKG